MAFRIAVVGCLTEVVLAGSVCMCVSEVCEEIACDLSGQARAVDLERLVGIVHQMIGTLAGNIHLWRLGL